jgi:alcohol dehydrogenase
LRPLERQLPLIYAKKLFAEVDTLPILGVHGKPVELQIQDRWIQNITITMGLVNTNTTPMLLKTVSSGKLEPSKLITHHFKLKEVLEEYEVFGNAGKEKAMKVIIEP